MQVLMSDSDAVHTLRSYGNGLIFMDIETPDRLVTVQMTGEEKHGVFHAFSPPKRQQLPSHVASGECASACDDKVAPNATVR